MRTMRQHIKISGTLWKQYSEEDLFHGAHSIKEEKNQQINDLTLWLKALEKEEQSNTKSSRRQEIVQIRAESNEIETKDTIKKIYKMNSWFFEKISQIDKPLATLPKRRREKTQITKIWNEQGNITTDTSEIQNIIRSYFENLCSNKQKPSKTSTSF